MGESLFLTTVGSLAALLVLAGDLAAAPEGQILPREVHGELPLVTAGEARASIVVAPGAEWRQVADDLAGAVRELTGVAVPVVEDSAVVGPDGRTVTDEYRHRPLVLVGNAVNHRGILPLYARWLDAADGRYPGGDGYELRTVVNPYGTGANELILGASTPTGASQGLAALKTHLAAALKGRDLVLPQLLEVRPGPALKPLFDQTIAEVRAHPERSLGTFIVDADLAEFCNDALRYAWTGEVGFAQRAKGVLLAMNRLFDGSYYHGIVRTCDDYSLEYAVRGWLILQHAGVLSPAELHETDRNLYHDFPHSAHGPGNIGSRHLLSGSMAFFVLVDGLLTYGNSDETARKQLTTWRDGIRAYFHGACATYRGDVDQAQDYGAMENVFKFALHDGYWDYFNSGWADRTVTQMLMNIDNDGTYSGVGGYGEAMPGSLHYGLAAGLAIRITAFVEHRADLRWILENVPNMGGAHLGFMTLGLHSFDLGEAVPAQPPAGALTGATLLKLDDYHHRLGQQSQVADGVGPISLPVEQCVDKVMFRDGFGRNDPYLLLNGYQATVMGCLDGNAIVRYCDGGEVWLFQSTMEEGHATKNAVWVSNGRDTDLIEGCVALRRVANLGAVAFSATVLQSYHGTDWERAIFRRRGGAFVVLDRISVKEPGDYAMACTWRSPRWAQLDDDGVWRSEAGGKTFTVRPAGLGPGPFPAHRAGRDGAESLDVAPGVRFTCGPDDDRFSAETPWTLRQWRRLTARAGEVVAFQNVFSVRPSAVPEAYKLRRVNDACAVLDDQGEPALLCVGRQTLPGLEVEAELAWLGASRLSAAGLRRLAVGGHTWLAATAPVDLALETADAWLSGTVVVSAGAELTLALPGLSGVSRDGGSTVVADGGSIRLTLLAGRHQLTCYGASAAALRQAPALRPAAPPRTKPGAAPKPVPAAGLRSAWTFDRLRGGLHTVRGIRVRSKADQGAEQAGPQAVVGDTFNTSQATWQAKHVEVTLGLPRETLIREVRITLHVGVVDLEQGRPDPLTIAAVEVHGKPLGRAPVRSWHYRRPFYGGQYATEVIDAITGLEQRGKTVKLVLEPPAEGGAIRLGRVQILTDGAPDTVSLKCRAVSGLGAGAWAVWDPDAGRVALLDALGQPLWQHDLHAAITAVNVGDRHGDGQNELAVTSTDWRLRLYDAAGAETLVRDFRGMVESTGGRYYYGGCPHGVGFLARPGQRERDLVVGHYYFLSYLSPSGELLKTTEGSACFWQDFLDTGQDLNGDGTAELMSYTETPWQTRVPLVVFDGAKREPWLSVAVGNGAARLMRPVKVGPDNCVAVGSIKGCGLYSLTNQQLRWYMAGETIKTSYALGDLDGDGQTEMVVGQRDGFVLVLDADGKIEAQWNLGEEVLAVGVLPGGPRVLVSMRSGTRVLDARGKLVGRWEAVVQAFEPAGDGLLALHADGRIERIEARGTPGG